ncbi:hypothetical protein SCNRRL3882_2852 [Streptomyces chartreusis NRRL 3882]|uniref:Uncharacterized protein n=1 Tax=Streptomyces chartreusis NRRL 3882 TaxID=1079985 RepID=A0A2N9B7T0_STRCX|nr:hypothetical protein SCNRRL3882_2852 [Streptomyces chartreusis NRRL 3882]
MFFWSISSETSAMASAAALLVGDPVAVLPVLFHLLWTHELVVDVSVPLHVESVVSLGRDL